VSNLLLPRGIRGKQVFEISAEEMAWLATAEDVLHKLQMTIVCRLCRSQISGSNDPADSTMKVTCECRRLIYRVRAETPTP
jgi:hypothetical protein